MISFSISKFVDDARHTSVLGLSLENARIGSHEED